MSLALVLRDPGRSDFVATPVFGPRRGFQGLSSAAAGMPMPAPGIGAQRKCGPVGTDVRTGRGS